ATARELLVEARLQVATVVPTGQHVGDAAAHEPRSIYRVLQTERGDHREMVQEIRGELAGEPPPLGAAEIETADDAVLASQRQQTNACERRPRRKQQRMVDRRERPEPRTASS